MSLKQIIVKFLSKHALVSFAFIFFISFVLLFVFLKIYILPPSNNSLSYSKNNQNVLGLNIPLDLDFCGEKIPSNSLAIKDDLEKEFFNNNYWKSNSAILFNKAQKWFPYIEPILKQQNVPDDFKYVAVIESHLSNITSPAGASGFWQLMPASAQNYGLEINEFVDERLDVEKSTLAACKHIKDAYAIFKNWTLSAAAYNLGIGGIQAALKKQNSTNYYNLLLNSETGSFIYRILAYKTLLSNPAHFGIKKKKMNYSNKIPMTAYKIDTSISNLDNLAIHIGCKVSTIKLYNPWLLGTTLLNPTNKTFIFKIPKNLEKDYSTYIFDLKPQQDSIKKNKVDELQILRSDSLKANSNL